MYNVLIVDDELLDLELLRDSFPWGELNLTVTASFDSSFAALEFMTANHIDILISDIKMPIMSGLELYMKAREVLPALKAVFISGYEDFKYAKRAIDMDASGYILKPVDDNELNNTLKKVILELNSEKLKESLGKKSNVTQPYRKLVKEIMLYVDKNTRDDVTLQKVADYFAYSANYLGHVFKDETGMNFSDYVIRRRLEKAAELLQDPKLKIQEISEAVGYENFSYFTRLFKEHFGVTPSSYRKDS